MEFADGNLADVIIYMMAFSLVKNIGPNPRWLRKSFESLRGALLANVPTLMNTAPDEVLPLISREIIVRLQPLLGRAIRFLPKTM
eukprot:15999-Heterocapsa_arctica.AAC.1